MLQMKKKTSGGGGGMLVAYSEECVSGKGK